MFRDLNAWRAGVRTKGWRLFLALGLMVLAPYSFAARILVLDMNGGFAGVPSNLESHLTASGHTVTLQVVPNAPPASFSTAEYDQVWVFGSDATSANFTALNTALQAYLAPGGAVYMQSEVGCCHNAAAAAEALMMATGNSTALLPGFAHSAIYDATRPNAVVNPALSTAEQACVPQLTGQFRAFRRTDNINVQNQLVIGMDAGDVSRGAGVVFLRADDMVSGQGALIVNGNRNLLSQGGGYTTALDEAGRAWVLFFASALANMAPPGGKLCAVPPPPPPSPGAQVTAVPTLPGWGLLCLGALVGLLGAARRRR